MKRSFKLVAIIFLLLLLVGFGVLVVYLDQQFSGSRWHQGEKVHMQGEIVCLPHKGDIHTMECAIGFKANNGKYYALADSSYYDTNTRVEVRGYLIPPDEDGQYNSSGTIEQAKVEKLK
jgi:hypothetical protein